MSVINQVLRDLDSRSSGTARPLSYDISKSISRFASHPNRNKQRLLWGVLLIGIFICTMVIWRSGDIDFELETGVTNANANFNRLQSLLAAQHAEHLIKATGIEGVVWRSHADGAIELILTLNSQPETAVQTVDKENGEKEFTFFQSKLQAPVPPLSAAAQLIEYYQLGEQGSDLVLTIMPQPHVNITIEYRPDHENVPRVHWVFRAEPVKKKSVELPAVVAEKEPAPVNIKARQPSQIDAEMHHDIKKPVLIRRSAETEYQQALVFIKAGQTGKAADSLQQALQINSSLHPARELLASLYLQTGQETEAFILLEQGIDQDPRYMPFTHIYAQALIQRGRLPEAKKALLETRASTVQDANYHALLGIVTQRLNEHEQAVSSYMRALELDAAQSAWWMGLGISLESLGQTDAAIGAYSEAMQSGRLNTESVAYIDSRMRILGKK